MKETFEKIFNYIPRDTSIRLYGLAHVLYIVLTLFEVSLVAILLRNKTEQTKRKVCNSIAFCIIFIYVFDFFVQPFWAGEISIGKLPFHICTATGVLIPFVAYNKNFKFLEVTITVWAVLAPLAFIFAPMNYINRPIEPYSYPIIQTFLFHALEFLWGVLMLTTGRVKLQWKNIWQPIVGLLPMALWAALGQNIYYGDSLGENFLFLRTDISGIAPQWLFIPALFMAASIAISILYLIYWFVTKPRKVKTVVK